MAEEIWHDNWPTEPGHYWFFGLKFRPYPADEKPKMYLVEVWRIANGLMYVVDGHFLYAEEGAHGKWTRAVLPQPPSHSSVFMT